MKDRMLSVTEYLTVGHISYGADTTVAEVKAHS